MRTNFTNLNFTIVDDDDDESIVDENENRKRRNEEAMKTIEREVAAATYDQLQSKIDSKQNASIGLAHCIWPTS